MFRSRFKEAFPKSLPNFGPQELERDVVDSVPGEHAEQFLCAVLGLLLNRKQDVKSETPIPSPTSVLKLCKMVRITTNFCSP